MKHPELNKDEIYNALRVLKKVCSMFEECEDCPFSKSFGVDPHCMIRYSNPDTYRLTDEDRPWRALRQKINTIE